MELSRRVYPKGQNYKFYNLDSSLEEQEEYLRMTVSFFSSVSLRNSFMELSRRVWFFRFFTVIEILRRNLFENEIAASFDLWSPSSQ